MNILFISHTAGCGGSETVLIDVIRTVSMNTNHNIFIALPKEKNDDFQKRLPKLDNIRNISTFSYKPARDSIWTFMRNIGYGIIFVLYKLKTYINDNKIDLVYVNSSVNIIGVLAARTTHRSLIWHIHEQSTDMHRWVPREFNKLYRKWFMNDSCKKIFVSNTSRQQWMNDLLIDEIANNEVIYSSYKEISPEIKKNKRFTFGFIGSISNNKNVQNLIAAFSILDQDYSLIIAGSGECEQVLRLKTQYNSNISFIGNVDNLQKYYASIDCLVLPSYNESWGLVVLEAMSAMVPVIATKNTGLTELFSNDIECVFVDPTSIFDISQAMKKIATDTNFREKIIKNATSILQQKEINYNFVNSIIKVVNES